MKYLNESLDDIFRKIKNGENFTLMRFGDGERSLILGKPVHAQEGWIAPSEITSLGRDLLEALLIDDPRVIIGISCPCCDREAYYWYSTHVASKNITFANIFVNKNYPRFLSMFGEIKRDAIVICNEDGVGRGIGNLNVLKYYPIGNQCVRQWDHEGNKIIKNIIEDYGDRNNLLYVFSAGPISEPLIYALFRNNPNNCYIDFGSAIDKYIHLKDERPYTDPTTIYGKRNCWMYGDETRFDVSVVIRKSKNPQWEKAIDSIKNQSLKPRQIIILDDEEQKGTSKEDDRTAIPQPEYKSIVREEINEFTKFDIVKEADSEYVCVVDINAVPGRRWLENCHYESIRQKGIYGACGVVVKYGKKDQVKKLIYFGEQRPYSKSVRVDWSYGSWFLKRSYMKFLFEKEYEHKSDYDCYADMLLSAAMYEGGVSTYVPPCPVREKDWWGGVDESVWREAVETTGKGEIEKQINRNLAVLVSDGWDLRTERNYIRFLQDEARITLEGTRHKLFDVARKGKQVAKRLINAK